MDPNPMTNVLMERENRDMQGRRPGDYGGRDWSSAKAAEKCQES